MVARRAFWGSLVRRVSGPRVRLYCLGGYGDKLALIGFMGCKGLGFAIWGVKVKGGKRNFGRRGLKVGFLPCVRCFNKRCSK